MSASNVSLLHETSRQVAAGGSAGLVEICLMHPLDVVKTRFQVQRSVIDPQSYRTVRGSFQMIFRTEGFQVQRSVTDPQSYRTVRGSFQMIFRTEGLFGFYKGIIPPILAETPKRAVKFSTFELYKKFLGYMSLSPGLTFLIAGLGSGLTEAVVVNPFEVVKVGLQVNRNLFKEGFSV